MHFSPTCAVLGEMCATLAALGSKVDQLHCESGGPPNLGMIGSLQHNLATLSVSMSRQAALPLDCNYCMPLSTPPPTCQAPANSSWH